MNFEGSTVFRQLVICSITFSLLAGCHWDAAPGNNTNETGSPSSASSVPTSPAGGAHQGVVAQAVADHGVEGPQSADSGIAQNNITGTHGGTIVPIGAASYHAEVVFEKTGQMRLLMLGKDETQIQDVEQQALQAYIQSTSEAAAEIIALFAAPQEGDSNGMTSQFTGQLPESLRGKEVEVTIPDLRIRGNRFRVGFKTAADHQEK